MVNAIAFGKKLPKLILIYPSSVTFRANPYAEGISAIAPKELIRVEKNRRPLSLKRLEDWEIGKVPGE